MLAVSLALLLATAQDPLAGQLPKRELGVAEFLAEHPEHDGRGIRVAVLDTGIDPGHPFLQTTPDGRRKLVDWYDATTDGRLDTSVTATAEDGRLTGLSGRALTLGRHAAPGRTYRLGRVDREFLPPNLRARLVAERREDWQREKSRWEEARVRLEAGGEDLEEARTAREAELARRYEDFADPGPVFDVVVFEDDGWRVVVDGDEDGDLDEETALRPFRASGDWAVLGEETLLNYAVDVAEGGDLTTLYFDAHGHGTHVAGIIANWEGEGSRLNGVAPGVELVAIKIGDGKYGGATSGFSVAKGLDYAVEAGCQVANMSFGGPSFFADGREPDAWVIEEAWKRGLILVTSAGNEGPALSTVGAPATASHALATAAAIWPDTQRVNYGALDPSAPVLFDFSSRGPLPNGSLGVDFTAPGAALSALPSWLLTRGENWNGTSMASPQLAGVVALLRGAAVAEGLPHDPARVYRALRLSARKLPQHAWVEVGHGFPYLPDAHAQLRRLSEAGAMEAEYRVRATNPFGEGAGIYLRALPDAQPLERTVHVEPVFAEVGEHAERAAFLRTLRVTAEADWLEVPEAIYLSAAGRSFPVRIRPAGLGHGLHSTRVLLWDDERPEADGAEVIVPVTLVLPLPAGPDATVQRSFPLEPGALERTFVSVPHGARRAVVTVVQRGGGRNEYRPGAGSVSGFRYAGDRQQRDRFFLEDGGTYETEVPVEAGTTFEYALASRWAVNTPAEIDLSIRFVGLVPQHEVWRVPAGQDTGYLALKSLLRSETVEASAAVEGVAMPITAPMRIEADPIRPTIMDGHGMFQGVIEWDVEIAEDGTAATLRLPRSIQTTEIREDLMLEIEDAAGAVQQRAIAYEVDTPLGAFDAGTYRFRLTFPSLGKDALQARFAGAELRLRRGGGALDLYGSLEDAFVERGGGARFEIPYRGARSVVARLPQLEPLPAGQYWYGSATFRSGERTLLEVPLRVERPLVAAAAEEAEEGDDAGAGEEASGADAGAEAADSADAEADADAQEPTPEEAFHAAMESAEATPLERIEKARAWQEAEPLEPRASLAVYRALAAAGLEDLATAQAVAFLGRFPRHTEEFLAAAPQWNGLGDS